ncbi:LacI family DNA-binding transcriptional regulator [Saccharomonospora viridis]|jgi:DNA-binding LacI/PurR family transcriptional regulator|uniref:Transcriptional regulator, LacI family n=1 Tax=Saccharomonospora viridis (strain ATCC 15386 / DSM 43017 / JCM 3036 / CCUG 5913 / NBRC 12207 / NCIMB 9602 / P101) TaxID=471857 RepID=C7MQ66_SACVD|nr:LacI family DNA-binding transcriptional regulator [Saccharomonospora viridis]ACU98489.1 transcriptional regulator, LacI family [Saccharomonospora viridis DSM 43017]SFP60986.1 transcriptional regulator, LacI family [Saccharomonospora viridis]
MNRPMRTRRQATLASLAAELGVSRTTVSNAYNRPDQLSPELRRRVLETARRLGYPGPDPVARSLRTRKAGAVGLLLTENLSYAFRDPAAVGVLEGLALACEKAGVGLHLVPASPGREEVAAVHRAGVDGFVVYSVPDDDPHLEAVLSRPVPTVIIDQPQLDNVDRVAPDDEDAIVRVANHVVGLGHRQIGVLCMRLARDRNDGFVPLERQQQARYHVQRARLAALAKTFEAAGVDWNTVPVVERFNHTVDDGATAARQLLDAHPRVTAIICTSDILALGALAEAGRRGLRVPADLTITGFDGIAEASRAGLTTVHQPVLEKGKAAGKLLLEANERVEPKVITLPTELRIGTTSAPPRTAEEQWFGP